MKTTRVFILAGVVALVFLMVVCTKSPVTSGTTGTDTGNAQVKGVLYNLDGTRAAHATVHIRKKSTLADTTGGGLSKILADTATVITNDSGVFRIDTIDTGAYVIEGTSGNNLALVDSVPVKSKDSIVTLPPDTLKPAGALKGVIRLSEGGDPRKVFILAFGIDRFAHVNADGSFKFSSLAEAKYDLRLISSLDNYGVLDTNAVPVISTDTTNLDTISLPFTGIPTPKNVSIAYDTLKQIVTLTWSKADTALVKSYNVYRRNVDSNTVPARINTNPITDTLCHDTTGIQDQTYEYSVVAVGSNAMEGTKSAAVSVKIVAAISAVGFGQSGLGQGTLHNPYRIAVQSDGNICVVDSAQRRVQVFDTVGNFVKRPQIQTASSIVGICATPRGERVIATPTEVLKYSANDSLLLTIDTLVQNASDITVDINGIIYVVGQDADSGGAIWKFDSTGKLIGRWLTGTYFQSIRVGPDSNVYVAGDQFAKIYTPMGILLNSITISLNLGGQQLHSRDLRDIVVTSSGQIIITDIESDQLFVLDKSGNIITKGGSFNNLTGLSLTKNGVLYGVESGGERILKLKYE
jgi:hypothetical protein